jgi:hypothetical protein
VRPAWTNIKSSAEELGDHASLKRYALLLGAPLVVGQSMAEDAGI